MKRAFTLVEILIAVALVTMLAAFLYPVFERMRDGRIRDSCQSNLNQLGIGLIQYASNYDETWPPARVTSAVGWADVIRPYVKTTSIFQCPQEQGPNSHGGFSNDYFYNRRLSRLTSDKLTSPALSILLGDGDDNAPTWNSWAAFPADATTNPSSPSQRHLAGANYLFADGHVKWCKPSNISSTYAAPTSRPTFAIR